MSRKAITWDGQFGEAFMEYRASEKKTTGPGPLWRVEPRPVAVIQTVKVIMIMRFGFTILAITVPARS